MFHPFVEVLMMQRPLRALVLALTVLVVGSTVDVRAEDPQQQIVLEETFPVSFGKVWAAIKQSMDVIACGKPQTEKVIEPEEVDGFYKGLYVSDYCMLSKGEDGTRDTIEVYSNVPRIRSGIWISARVQFKISVREESRNKTKIVLKAEMSGFEEFITSQVHFWNSNGILENRMMTMIKTFVAQEAGKGDSNE